MELGDSLYGFRTVINLISNTATSKGLKIVCIEDKNKYELGTVVTDKELAAINMKRDSFHGDWNYTILPIK